MNKLLLFGFLKFLFLVPLLAFDHVGRAEVLHWGWHELVAVDAGGEGELWAAPAVSLETPGEIVGVCADESGVSLAVAHVWDQYPQRFAFVFGIGVVRFSRMWQRVAVGVKVERRGQEVQTVPVVAWECSEDPVLEEGNSTGRRLK